MELAIQQRIKRDHSHQLAMQKAMADAASSMTVYQKHVVNNQTVDTRHQTPDTRHQTVDTDSEDDENVCEEEESLKQQLRSLDKDIKVLNTDNAAFVTEMEKLEKSFNFRQTWARAEFGEEWQGSSPAPPVTEAENQAASNEMEQ